MKDSNNGTYSVTVVAQVSCEHYLTVTIGGHAIPGSPFIIQVSPGEPITPAASFLKSLVCSFCVVETLVMDQSFYNTCVFIRLWVQRQTCLFYNPG